MPAARGMTDRGCDARRARTPPLGGSNVCIAPAAVRPDVCPAAPAPRHPAAGADTSASLSAAAAPSVFIEELPHPAAETGLDAAAVSCEAMEE